MKVKNMEERLPFLETLKPLLVRCSGEEVKEIISSPNFDYTVPIPEDSKFTVLSDFSIIKRVIYTNKFTAKDILVIDKTRKYILDGITSNLYYRHLLDKLGLNVLFLDYAEKIEYLYRMHGEYVFTDSPTEIRRMLDDLDI